MCDRDIGFDLCVSKFVLFFKMRFQYLNEMLADLQGVHDRFTPKTWPKKLNELEKKWFGKNAVSGYCLVRPADKK